LIERKMTLGLRGVDRTEACRIVNHMVKHLSGLDCTFGALSVSSRRAIIERLASGAEIPVSQIAAPLPISLPAVLKHLSVLADAGLIERQKTGRTVYCRLAARPLEEAMQWLQKYERFWAARLDALAAFVEEETPCPSPSSQASPSSATSGRRSRRSSRRGPPRKR
jgi:DNA-binding transcriptional ArsR family regulator